MSWGFGLTNNNANMKRVEGRIKELEAKEVMRNDKPQTEFNFEGGKIVINYEADRIQIKHDSKPDSSIIAKLKSNGFKWSHNNQAWQRQITQNAMYVTKNLYKEFTAI